MYAPKPKRISIVIVENGHERPLEPKEKRPMAQPGTKRMPLVKSRVEHLVALTEKAYDLCSHWDPEFETNLDAAHASLTKVAEKLDTLPEGFVAPRKPVTRKFEKLGVGAVVRLTEKAQKKYMGKLAGKPLTVVSITDGWAEVQLEGDPQKPTVEVKHLVAA